MADDEPSVYETYLAQRLAHNHGWIEDDDDWEHKLPALKKDYLDLARETLAVTGGPSEAQLQLALMTAEVHRLRHQRDRYRKAWRSACRRARKPKLKGRS